MLIRLGRQRWRIRGRIQTDDRQLWDEEEMVFLPHIHGNFEIKVSSSTYTHAHTCANTTSCQGRLWGLWWQKVPGLLSIYCLLDLNRRNRPQTPWERMIEMFNRLSEAFWTSGTMLIKGLIVWNEFHPWKYRHGTKLMQMKIMISSFYSLKPLSLKIRSQI